METVGDRLRKARDNMGLTQKEVSSRTGITDKSLSRYETNATEPDTDSLRRLSELYGVTSDWIIGNKIGSQPKLPQSVYDELIKEAEEHYKISLQGDPFVYNTMKQIVDNYAKSKMNQQSDKS